MPNLEMVVMITFRKKNVADQVIAVRADTMHEAELKALAELPEELLVQIKSIDVKLPDRTQEGNPNDGWSYGGPGGYRTYDLWGYCDNPARGY